MGRIFLIGMPAAGKSYWAQRLSGLYGHSYIDLDVVIEAATGKTVPVIFAEQGEIIFREKEKEALHHVIANAVENTFIACGGGTPCFFDNMERMKNNGTVIYLQVPVDTLLLRIGKQGKDRPLLKGAAQFKNDLEQLLHIRKPIFEKAHHILHDGNISLANFEKIIASCTSRQ